VVVFGSNIDFLGNSLGILYIRQRIKRRYKEKARLKYPGDPDFLARVLRVAVYPAPLNKRFF